MFMKILKNAIQTEYTKLILFDMITDMLSNKKPLTNSYRIIYQRYKTKHFFNFITQSYFAVPKNIRVDSAHYYHENSRQTTVSTNWN